MTAACSCGVTPSENGVEESVWLFFVLPMTRRYGMVQVCAVVFSLSPKSRGPEYRQRAGSARTHQVYLYCNWANIILDTGNARADQRHQ
jgi:hypothetical protein